MKAFIIALTIIMTACVLTGCATEYHVSTAGLDENSSTQSESLKTIPATVGVSSASDKNTPVDAENGFIWKSVIPADCPFKQSQTLTGIFFTGRNSDYRCGDTFYPSWASDGNMYSPWTDEVTDGVRCTSGGSLERGFHTGHAVMIGDDPLMLVIKNTSPPKRAFAKPYRGRYPCGSLVHEGIYRERVNPPRGGESDTKRIVYQAAAGEKVVIIGSEIIKGWQTLWYADR